MGTRSTRPVQPRHRPVRPAAVHAASLSRCGPTAPARGDRKTGGEFFTSATRGPRAQLPQRSSTSSSARSSRTRAASTASSSRVRAGRRSRCSSLELLLRLTLRRWSRELRARGHARGCCSSLPVVAAALVAVCWRRRTELRRASATSDARRQMVVGGERRAARGAGDVPAARDRAHDRRARAAAVRRPHAVCASAASTWSSRSTSRRACWRRTCDPRRIERAKAELDGSSRSSAAIASASSRSRARRWSSR